MKFHRLFIQFWSFLFLLLFACRVHATSFSITPITLDFGNVNQGLAGKDLPFKITNLTTNQTLSFTVTLDPANPRFSLSQASFQLEPKNSLNVTVHLKTNFDPGPVVGTVKVVSGGEVQRVALKANVVGVPDLTFIGGGVVVQVQATQVDVTVPIVNVGNGAPAGASTGVLVVDGVQNQNFPVPKLSATIPTNQTIIILHFPKGRAGTHLVQVTLDQQNVVKEAREDNNVATKRFSIP